MKKKLPSELNKKIKRLITSRDGVKQNNREKNLINQKLRDRTIEITEGRERWKQRSKELEEELSRQRINCEKQIQAAREETEVERIRANQERERAEKLQAEVGIIWGKKSRA